MVVETGPDKDEPTLNPKLKVNIARKYTKYLYWSGKFSPSSSITLVCSCFRDIGLTRGLPTGTNQVLGSIWSTEKGRIWKRKKLSDATANKTIIIVTILRTRKPLRANELWIEFAEFKCGRRFSRMIIRLKELAVLHRYCLIESFNDQFQAWLCR